MNWEQGNTSVNILIKILIVADGWISTSLPPSHSETSLLSQWPLSLRHGGSVCRWIKYYGIKICGSGSLSSGASTLPGNGGRDNQQETRWYTKAGKRGKATHVGGWAPAIWNVEFSPSGREKWRCQLVKETKAWLETAVFFCLVMTATQRPVIERMDNLSLTQRRPVAEHRTV